jgi:hypothetical protein
MSYDLLVYAPSLPDNLREQWQAALAACGLLAEVQPEFVRAEQSGTLAWKFGIANPDAFRFASLYPPFAVDAGFDLTVRPAVIDLAEWKRAPADVVARVSDAAYEVVFSNPHACTPADFRLQWFAAATLTQLCDGVLLDPQEERSFLSKQALAEAEFQAEKYEEEAESDWPTLAEFQGW